MPDKKSLNEICKFFSSPLSEKHIENYPKFEEKVEKHIIKEKQKLEEKGNYLFFYDEPKKKYFNSINEIERAIIKNPEKYANRKLISLERGILEKSKRKGINEDIVLFIKVLVFNIEKNGHINKNNKYGAIIHWKIMDFVISKLTSKLLTKLIELIVEKKIETGGLGFSLSRVICKQLINKKTDISDYLSPIEI